MGVEKRKSIQPADGGHVLGATAFKPVERHGWEAIKYFVHNPETGAWFSRTPKSWFQIILFYSVYYTLLACFWYGLLQVFFTFLPDNQPKYIMDESIIGTNPGVGLKPDQPDVTIDSSMVWLVANDTNSKPTSDFESASNADWAARYQRFLKKYENTTGTRDCPDGSASPMDEDACRFDIGVLGECAQFPYGFVSPSVTTTVRPCLLLKINRIFGWVPEAYTDDDIENSEDPVPANVKKLIQADRNKIYLDCVGENPADREAMEGNLDYFPQDQGISFKYFPFNHARKRYQNPIVAVRFNNLPIGQLLHVECKLWAKGVAHNSKDRIGQVHFEIFLNEKKKKQEA